MNGKLVVLIDNDADDLALLEGAVKETSAGVRCISCVFPDEAVDLIRNYLKVAPDFVFIDVNMSRMTGPECLLALKTIDGMSECKIVMFSGVMPAAVGEAFKKLGAWDYFQKPLLGSQYKLTLAPILREVEVSPERGPVPTRLSHF